MTDDQRQEFLSLFDRYIEERLTQEEVTQLDDLLTSNEEARRLFIRYAHQHGMLHWKLSGNEGISFEALETNEKTNPTTRQDSKIIPFPRSWAALVASIALLFCGIWMGMHLFTTESETASQPITPALEPQAVAKLIETINCQWQSSSLPTAQGSLLVAGRLRLASGIAKLEFLSGATITLEAPADLEIVDSMNCVLHSGMLIANVPPPAQGFTVDTTQAKLIDYGTEFGVNVDPADGTTQVQVFEGIVDVEHSVSGEIKRMNKGIHSSIDADAIRLRDSGTPEPGMRQQRISQGNQLFDTVLTTAQGRGKDAYIQTGPQDIHTSDVLLLLKNTETPSFRRKAYLSFDLGSLGNRKIKQAEIRLTAKPSGYGFATLVQDSVFAIYGVTRDASDTWNPDALNWDNAPANGAGASEVDPDAAVFLGEFTVPMGAFEGSFTLSTPELVDFLNKDNNRLATLVLVRQTLEQRSGGLVHGFASSRHPTAAPPTLRLVTE